LFVIRQVANGRVFIGGIENQQAAQGRVLNDCGRLGLIAYFDSDYAMVDRSDSALVGSIENRLAACTAAEFRSRTTTLRSSSRTRAMPPISCRAPE